MLKVRGFESLNIKNVKNESFEPWLPQLHHADISGVLDEKFYATYQEWNEYKLALGWFIDDSKGKTR